MNDGLLLLISGLGSGAFVALINALFARRKTGAEADVTVGEAWSQFVQTQANEIAGLRRDNAELKGELRAAQRDINRLERREREAAYWQAQVTTREAAIGAQLSSLGVTIPPMPPPPVAREAHTRVGDNEGGRP